jgi:hypothetical protein
MVYSAEISRRNPTCLVFLVDQSGSMSDSFGGSLRVQKAGFVADALNRTLQNLVITCSKNEGIRDYFFIGVIGYGDGVGPALAGALAGRDLVPVSEVAANPARVEERRQKEPDGAGGVIDVPAKFPIWFDPRASGATPMCEAFALAHTTLQGWIASHPDSFPPIVLHLTDGESTDGDPTSSAEQLKSLSTSDGEVLLLNLHVSSRNADPVSFPTSEAALPVDSFARLLFRLSSPLVAGMVTEAQAARYPVQEGARGFVFNGGIEQVVDFFAIGTRPAPLR